VGEPGWTELIDTLCAANPEFARLWAEHPIAEPGLPVTKAFQCFGLGTVRVRASGFAPARSVGLRMVVYIPETAADAALIDELRARVARRLQPA
jgi:hypothetical protein